MNIQRRLHCLRRMSSTGWRSFSEKGNGDQEQPQMNGTNKDQHYIYNSEFNSESSLFAF